MNMNSYPTFPEILQTGTYKKYNLPPIIFTVLYRMPFDTSVSCRIEPRSVYLLDLALVAIFGTLITICGLHAVLLLHLPGHRPVSNYRHLAVLITA